MADETCAGEGGSSNATWLFFLPSLYYPADTIAQWCGFMVLLFLIWGKQFFKSSTPKSILRDHANKKEDIEALSQAALAYTKEEMKKDEDERKLPEPTRLLQLLWDEVRMHRTTEYGIQKDAELTKKTTKMFKDVLALHIKETISLTQRSYDIRTKKEAGDDDEEMKTLSAEEVKKIFSHESGEKLNEQLEFAKKVEKDLGEEYVDKDLLEKGRLLARKVYLHQSKNIMSIFHLVRPVLLPTLLSIALGILVQLLRARFHQIGMWSDAANAAAAGDLSLAHSLLFNLWVGHMLIKFINLPATTYDCR